MSNKEKMGTKGDYEFYVFADLWDKYNSDLQDCDYDQKFNMILSASSKFEGSEFNLDDRSRIDCIIAYFDSVEKRNKNRVSKVDLLAMLARVPEDGYLDLIVADNNSNWGAVDISLNQGNYGDDDIPYTELVITLEDGYSVSTEGE